MGVKMLWLGVTVWAAVPALWHQPYAPVPGAIIMLIGCILLWLDK